MQMQEEHYFLNENGSDMITDGEYSGSDGDSGKLSLYGFWYLSLLLIVTISFPRR